MSWECIWKLIGPGLDVLGTMVRVTKIFNRDGVECDHECICHGDQEERVGRERSAPGRLAGAAGVHRRSDARHERAQRSAGDGSLVWTSGASVDAGGRWLSLSRRGLESPRYRITRSSTWTEEVNPWKDKDRLPLLEGGLLGDLIYGDEPRLIDDITPLLAADDPAIEYLAGFRSLMAVPHYDQGVAINMVILLEREAAAFDPEIVPRVGLGQQPVRPGDAQPRPER